MLINSSFFKQEDKTFRESLPTNYLQYMGVVHQDDVSITIFKLCFSFTNLYLLFLVKLKPGRVRF